VGQEGESDVPVPTVPASYLVVREAHFAFCFLKADLHSPAAAGYLRQLFERGALGGEDAVGALLIGLFDGAPYQQSSFNAFLKWWV
jgi:hypothetical protein